MPPLPKIYPAELFFTFSKLGLMGFGGVMPWVYSEIVERKKWLSPLEFSELLALGQILPGANVTNFSAMLGYRFSGFRGAFAATLGLLTVPLFIGIGFAVLYQHYGQHPVVQGVLTGITAVACGLIISTGYKLAKAQPRTIQALITGSVAMVAVGLFAFPLIAVVLTLAPLGLMAEVRATR